MRDVIRNLFKKTGREIVFWIEGIITNIPYSTLGNCLRRLYWGRKLKIPGKDIAIFPGVRIVCTETLTIGTGVSVNFNVLIDSCQGYITIGDNVLIGPNCVLRAADHIFSNPKQPIKTQGHRGGNIIIEDDVWLGANVVVLKWLQSPWQATVPFLYPSLAATGLFSVRCRLEKASEQTAFIVSLVQSSRVYDGEV